MEAVEIPAQSMAKVKTCVRTVYHLVLALEAALQTNLPSSN